MATAVPLGHCTSNNLQKLGATVGVQELGLYEEGVHAERAGVSLEGQVCIWREVGHQYGYSHSEAVFKGHSKGARTAA